MKNSIKTFLNTTGKVFDTALIVFLFVAFIGGFAIILGTFIDIVAAIITAVAIALLAVFLDYSREQRRKSNIKTRV